MKDFIYSIVTNIYYLSALFFVFYEMTWLSSPIEKTKDSKKFHELGKEFKGKKWDEFSQKYKDEIKSKIGLVFLMIWLLMGLFTYQWIVFLFLMCFNFLIITPISKILRYSMAYTVLHWLNSLIGFVFGVFVIVNHYHLKLDLTKIFLYYFK